MRTVPTNFAPFKDRLGAFSCVIVKLTDGTNTWYFSDSDIEISDGRVYNLVESVDGINESVDIFAKDWSLGNAVITMSNLAVIPDGSGGYIRASELLADITGESATVYFACGQLVTALTDCVTYFVGVVDDGPAYDDRSLTVGISGANRLSDKIVPSVRMVDIFTGCPAELQQQPIPLLYGRWTYVHNSPSYLDVPMNGVGMAKGFPTTRGTNPKFVFANHAINAITAMYLDKINGTFPYYDSATLTADDSGYATGQGDSRLVKCYFRPTTKPLYDDLPERFDYAMNTRPVTFTNNDFQDGGPTGGVTVEFVCNFDPADEGSILSMLQSNKDIDEASNYCVAVITWAVNSGFKHSYSIVRMYHANGASDLSARSTANAVSGSNTLDQSTTDIPGNKNDRLVLALEAQSNAPDSGGDSVTLNQTPFSCTRMDLIVPYVIPEGYPFRVVTKRGDVPNEEVAWAVCEGRKFGSWITASGRSVGGYSPGDVIEDPVFIIESLLRDELGLSTSSIDTSSFDSAYNSDVEARIQITERTKLSEVIRQLCEQSTSAFMWSSTGKAKMIDLDRGNAPTTSRKIPYSHIVDGHIGVNRLPTWCERATVRHYWLPQFNQFRYSGDWPGTDYPKKRTFEWRNIVGGANNVVGGSVGEVLKNYVSGTQTGIWNRNHEQIEFATYAMTNVDIEVGDWIELDAATVDPHMDCYGDSWDGKQFLVVSTEQTIDGTRIKAIALY